MRTKRWGIRSALALLALVAAAVAVPGTAAAQADDDCEVNLDTTEDGFGGEIICQGEAQPQETPAPEAGSDNEAGTTPPADPVAGEPNLTG